MTGKATPLCARRHSEHIDWMTGEMLPDMCGANTCPACGPYNAARRIRAIALACPTHLVTLTDIGDDPIKIGEVMTEVFRRLRRKGYQFEAVQSVECNQGGRRRAPTSPAPARLRHRARPRRLV
ncbi:ribosomal protein L32 [Marmoricola sp. URHA0025 HA25]